MKKHHVIVLLWFMISVIGAGVAFSATFVDVTIRGGNAFIDLLTQLILICIVLIAGVITFFYQKKIDMYKLMKKYSELLMYFTICALIAVFLIGDFSIRSGARMVIPLGFVDFQPLELFKIALLLYFATKFSTVKPTDTIGDNLKKLILPIIGLLLIMKQPDFGGAMICAIIIFFLLIVNGQNLKQLFSLSGIVALIGLAGFSFLHEYQKARIFMWLNPFNDAQNTGYQLINSYVAISNGGLLGSGYMSGIQKAGYLSQPGSDFIFATICEEFGIIGALITITSLFCIAIVAIRIGNKAHERFGMLYCYGFAILIFTQTFINIGGVTGVIPMTGVTLPFISVGVNSYLFLSLGVFLTVPISKMSIKEKNRERKVTNFKG